MSGGTGYEGATVIVTLGKLLAFFSTILPTLRVVAL